MTPLLNKRQAAEVLGWSVFTMQQRRFRGQAPSYLKLDGKSIRYEIQELKNFIEQGRVNFQGVM